MFGLGHGDRITKLEDGFASVNGRLETVDGRLGGVEQAVGGMRGSIDKLVEGLSNTGEEVVERSLTVKSEIRDENDRKAKDRSSLMRDTLQLLGFVLLVVAAFCGPYLNKINSTASGQQDDTFRIAQVRETIAGMGANEGQMQNDNKSRDAELREHDQDLAFMKGVMAAKGWPAK